MVDAAAGDEGEELPAEVIEPVAADLVATLGYTADASPPRRLK